MDKYVTKQEFDQKMTDLQQSYELTRKLLNHQAKVLNQKVDDLRATLEQFMSRKPDPRIIRDAWIKQIPKVREELQRLQLQFARFAAKPKETVPSGAVKSGVDNVRS